MNNDLLVICDLDGTLVDSREDLAAAVNLMLSDFGQKRLDLQTVTGYVGNGMRKLVERSIRGSDIEFEAAVELTSRYYKKKIVDKTFLYEGVKSGLKKLHDSGIKVALASNKPTDFCREILEKLNVAVYFSEILGGGEFPLKPDPASILYLMKKNANPSAETWIIGDNYTDLEAGRLANIKRCFATYGFGFKKAESFDLEVSSFLCFVDRVMYGR